MCKTLNDRLGVGGLAGLFANRGHNKPKQNAPASPASDTPVPSRAQLRIPMA